MERLQGSKLTEQTTKNSLDRRGWLYGKHYPL